MRRILKWTGIGAGSLGLVAVLLLIGGYAYAQFSGNWEFQNMIFFNSSCSTATPGHAPLKGNAMCLDTTSLAFYIWSGTAFVAPAFVSSTLTNPVINGGIKNGTGYNSLIIASPVAMCTTSNTVGALCSEPTQTFGVGFADTSYVVNCTCAAVGTNVPVVEAVTKASNTLVVSIAALTAASASCSEIDCIAAHQ